ncbi:MAG: hypothetical protein AAGD35_19955 [Actinomycetota bacterium]
MSRRTALFFGDGRPRRRRGVRRVVVLSIVPLAALVVGLIGPAAADDDLTITPDEVVRGEPGALITVATEAIPAEFVGQTCDIRITTRNGSSVHPGNAVLTTTAGKSFITPGVEESADGRVADINSVELGDTLLVQLQMGVDGVSSLGFTVSVDCPDPDPGPSVIPALVEAPTTTTTTAAPSTTTTSSAPPSTTSTTEAAPPTTAPTTAAPSSTAPPTVLPALQENPLPPAAPAAPIQGDPSHLTG